MIEVELPDGTIAEFPEGTGNDVIKGALQKRFGAPKAPQVEPAKEEKGWSAASEADKIEAVQKPGAFSDATASVVAKGIPFADEIVGGMMAPVRAVKDWAGGNGFDLGRSYDRSVELERELQRRREDRSPIASTVGSIAGGTALGGVAAKGGLTLLQGAKPTLASMAARGAGEGAAYGAIYGAGEGDGIDQRARGAISGGLIGGGLGGVTGALGRIGAGKVADDVVPSAGELKDLGRAAYKAVDDAGVIVKPEGLQNLAATVKNDLAEFGYHPDLQPRIGTVLKELDRVSEGNSTFSGVDTLRKIAASAGASTDPSEKALAAKIIGRIDDYMTGIGPDDVVAGNVDQATTAIKQARDYWSRGKKNDLIENALNAADLRAASTGSGGNVDNATRQNLRAILSSPSKSRGFTSAEKEAMETVVRGTPVQNALRLAGKLSPQGNGLMAALGVGGAMVNPVVGALSLGGMGAKAAADSMTRNNTAVLQALIRNGGNELPQALLSAPRKAIVEALSRSGGQMLPGYTSRQSGR